MLNVAVVGCGYWGPNLIRNFDSLSDCNVTHVCDRDTGRLDHIKSLNPNVQTTMEFNDIVNNPDIDAVAIATPVHTHYDLGMKCLEAGKHVFLEKPMAPCVKQCVELNSVAAQRNLTIMVGHTFVYSPVVRKIKEIVKSGELGDIQYISSRRLNLGLFQKDINVAWDLAPHDLSIILYILDEAPQAINCQGKAHYNPEIEDVTNISIDFPSGAFATVHSSWLDPNKIRETTIVGTKRMLVYNDMEPLEKIKIYDKRVDGPQSYDTFGEFQFAYHYGDTYCPYVKQVETLRVECQHFLDCINTGQKSDSSGIEGLQVVQILEAATNSLRNGGSKVEVTTEPICNIEREVKQAELAKAV